MHRYTEVIDPEVKALNLKVREAREYMLEECIDAASLQGVIEALASVCNSKAVHLVENWQDIKAGAAWNRAARALDSLAGRSSVSGL